MNRRLKLRSQRKCLDGVCGDGVKIALNHRPCVLPGMIDRTRVVDKYSAPSLTVPATAFDSLHMGETYLITMGDQGTDLRILGSNKRDNR